jgi:hypothetical protein
MKGLDFQAIRQALAPFGWSLARTHAGDGPTSYFATRKGKVRHLPDLAAAAQLVSALQPKPVPQPVGKVSRHWWPAHPAWGQQDYMQQVHAADDQAAMHRHLERSRAGIVRRVRSELPAELVQLVDAWRLVVHCHPAELQPFGRAWRAEVFVPFDLAGEFVRHCGGIPCWCAGGQVIGRRLFLVFELSAQWRAPRPWREVWGQ